MSEQDCGNDEEENALYVVYTNTYITVACQAEPGINVTEIGLNQTDLRVHATMAMAAHDWKNGKLRTITEMVDGINTLMGEPDFDTKQELDSISQP